MTGLLGRLMMHVVVTPGRLKKLLLLQKLQLLLADGGLERQLCLRHDHLRLRHHQGWLSHTQLLLLQQQLLLLLLLQDVGSTETDSRTDDHRRL